MISVSLDGENMEALEGIREAYGLGGRSEAVRAAISAAMANIREMDAMEGDVEGVLIIVRRNHEDPWMNRIQGNYESVIKTQLHSHLRDRKCLEVMVVSCEASVLASMLRDIQAEGKADYMKFVRGRGARGASRS